MEQQPSYYSIIPATVRYDKRLAHKGDEKLLFGEVTALSNVKGYCYASNNYFAELYSVDKVTISRWINHLKKLGYFKIEIDRNDKKQITQRRIYPIIDPINTDVNRGIDSNVNRGINTDVKPPINTDVKGNSTSINTTSKNSNNNGAEEYSKNPFEIYTEATHKDLNSFQSAKFIKYIEHFGNDLVTHAIKFADANNSPNFGFIDSVLNEWERNNIKTIPEADAYQTVRKQELQRKMKANSFKQNSQIRKGHEDGATW